jgi:uncharacterized delta-60 repeat protein
VALLAHAQAPFALDTTFRTQIQTQFVASALPLEDGKILLSGRMRFPDDLYDRLVLRLNADGSHDQTFPGPIPGGAVPGGGKITPWQDRYYVGTLTRVRRIWLDGTIDYDFAPAAGTSSIPYVSSLQGGDYHVFPDGRVVMSGLHQLSDSIRGFMGYHNFIWFTNTGYLDTTRVHRKGNGTNFHFKELADGRFICSGTGSIYDERPVDRIFRIEADGSVDTTFHTSIAAGRGQVFHELADGRIYVGGYYVCTAHPDTLYLARLLPDGGLDPTFTPPNFFFGLGDNPGYGYGTSVRSIYPLGPDHFIIGGRFRYVNGQPRRGICVIDHTGALLDEFHDQGVGTFQISSMIAATVAGIAPTVDGESYIIWGAYHGYDDGLINDTGQRFVSRLHAGDLALGAGPSERGPQGAIFNLYPNPATNWTTVEYDLPLSNNDRYTLVIKDALGRTLQTIDLRRHQAQVVLDTRSYSGGIYHVELVNGNRVVEVKKLVVQQ